MPRPFAAGVRLSGGGAPLAGSGGRGASCRSRCAALVPPSVVSCRSRQDELLIMGAAAPKPPGILIDMRILNNCAYTGTSIHAKMREF